MTQSEIAARLERDGYISPLPVLTEAAAAGRRAALEAATAPFAPSALAGWEERNRVDQETQGVL